MHIGVEPSTHEYPIHGHISQKCDWFPLSQKPPTANSSYAKRATMPWMLESQLTWSHAYSAQVTKVTGYYESVCGKAMSFSEIFISLMAFPFHGPYII